MTRTYEVIVGNVGTVHTGNNKREAEKIYRLYVAKSQHGEGRVAGEPVSLFENDVQIREAFIP